MTKKMPKKAQEEMVGFAMIIIIVSVIILVLLGIALNKPEASKGVESYEVESFIQALLQHTSECSLNSGLSYIDIEDLIAECDSGNFCDNLDESAVEDRIKACDVLNSTVKSLVGGSWKAGENRPVKGYEFNITSEEKNLISLVSGNITQNYREGTQDLSKRGGQYLIKLKVYY